LIHHSEVISGIQIGDCFVAKVQLLAMTMINWYWS